MRLRQKLRKQAGPRQGDEKSSRLVSSRDPEAAAKKVPGDQYACPNVFTVHFLKAASNAKIKCWLGYIHLCAH